MESKDLASDSNPLIQKDFVPVRGWAILIFLLALPVLPVPAVWLVRGQGVLVIIAAFFGVGLLAVLAAVAPMGWSALPALGFRTVGWRPVVLGVLADRDRIARRGSADRCEMPDLRRRKSAR